MVRFRRGIRRRPDGSFEVRIGDTERSLLESVSAEVRELVAGDQDGDDRLARLFPPTYGEDTVKEAEFQAMFGDELRTSHLAALDLLCATARETTIDEPRALAWMQAINSVRLVLGTLLDVDEEPQRVGPRHPQAPLFATYEYLGGLLWELVEALGDPTT